MTEVGKFKTINGFKSLKVIEREKIGVYQNKLSKTWQYILAKDIFL